ncbi:unnamed protein product [Vicia faba]|uniref:Uncharacterized protein n=1 Tax=Vicia faba TaxID=3906 RepID=A0AAV0YVS9_VICFA|nr:unnamed protein product [Vicia faba]
MTKDSPIVGLANGGNLDTPSEKQKASRIKNTPGSGEALLRVVVEIHHRIWWISNTHQQQSISQVEDEKYEIAKSLDFSEKSQVSEECNSEASYQEVTTQGSCVGSCSVGDNASIWSMQVNKSNNDDDDVEEEIAEEDDDGGDYECDLGLDKLCKRLNKVNVNEKAVLNFAGKHIGFVYDSDNEIVKEEEDESVGGGDDVDSNVLHLKGLPMPKEKHRRFSEEGEEEEKSYM